MKGKRDAKGDLDRRRFLLWGGAAVTAGTVVSLDWSDCPAASRRPAWHPNCSGFHGAQRLVVRYDVDASSYQQTVLRSLDVRLWCLCAGKLTEQQIVDKVHTEQAGDRDIVERGVRRFLTGMYASGYLMPLRAGDSMAGEVHELEVPAGVAPSLSRLDLNDPDTRTVTSE